MWPTPELWDCHISRQERGHSSNLWSREPNGVVFVVSGVAKGVELLSGSVSCDSRFVHPL